MGKLINPIKNFKTNGLQYKTVWPPSPGKLHCGVDCNINEKGTPVVAIKEGTVRHVNTMKEWDSVVCIEHISSDAKNKYTSVYWHLEQIKVKEGQKVGQGQQLGVVGQNNGLVKYRDHLHFGIRYAPYNPEMSLKGALPKNQFPELFRNPVEFLRL